MKILNRYLIKEVFLSIAFVFVALLMLFAFFDLIHELGDLGKGSYRLGVALRSIWHRPSALKDFMSLHARALEAADRLSSCVQRLVEALPPV